MNDMSPDIESIHQGTAVYTSAHEIDALLDHLDWPACGGALVDPACGAGAMLERAVARLAPQPGDMATMERVSGIEFHAPSADEARSAVRGTLEGLGWSEDDAARAAAAAVETRDFLLDRPRRRWDVILANPPYWRARNLSETYRSRLGEVAPPHARSDLLHAYLHAMTGALASGGRMGVVTSDRWLINSGAAALREEVGATLSVAHAERLDTRSAFYRPKNRVKGAPPRVHAVALVLTCDAAQTIGRTPFRIEEPPRVDGIPFADLVDLRLAPWLGPDGIFTVDERADLPAEHLVPCVEPADICPRSGEIGPTRRWAVVTGEEAPPAPVLRHLDRELHRMPPRGRRAVRWLPPERFAGRLPLDRDAILVPRIAQRLRAVTLPAGALPTNHSLVVASGMPVHTIRRMLEDPRVQAQADACAAPVESGYRSYTATLLRQLVIPHDLVEQH